MGLVKGQVVYSRAGRDVTAVYAVVGTQQDRILLADGAKRTLHQPKKKNRRHLMPTKVVLPPDVMADDALLTKALTDYTQKNKPHQGGE